MQKKIFVGMLFILTLVALTGCTDSTGGNGDKKKAATIIGEWMDYQADSPYYLIFYEDNKVLIGSKNEVRIVSYKFEDKKITFMRGDKTYTVECTLDKNKESNHEEYSFILNEDEMRPICNIRDTRTYTRGGQQALRLEQYKKSPAHDEMGILTGDGQDGLLSKNLTIKGRGLYFNSEQAEMSLDLALKKILNDKAIYNAKQDKTKYYENGEKSKNNKPSVRIQVPINTFFAEAITDRLNYIEYEKDKGIHFLHNVNIYYDAKKSEDENYRDIAQFHLRDAAYQLIKKKDITLVPMAKGLRPNSRAFLAKLNSDLILVIDVAFLELEKPGTGKKEKVDDCILFTPTFNAAKKQTGLIYNGETEIKKSEIQEIVKNYERLAY